ncbi:MAG: leucine-rich repeat protein [Ruminococcus sp.]|nr:leucine-rich repeat protein [Ruminococcus sp.]
MILKKSMSLILSAIVICSVFTVMPISASSAETDTADSFADSTTDALSGQTGDINWKFTESTGVLRLWGQGKTEEFKTTNDIPWESQKSLIKSIVVKEGVTYIGKWAFYDCTNVTKVSLPQSLTKMGDSVFCNCRSLEKITLPDDLKIIPSSAFEYCSSLKKFNLPKNLEIINVNAFDSCMGLTSLDISVGSEVIIGGGAFDHCVSLKSVNIGDGVKEIYNDVFSSCSSLETINIGAGVKTIHSPTFKNCEKLKKITVASENTAFTTIDGNLYNKNKTELIAYCLNTSEKTFTIPSSVKTITQWAFYMAKNLTSMTIPKNVTKICDNAFRECTNLKTINIQGDVVNICDCAFYETAWYENKADGMVYIGKTAYDYKGTCPEKVEIKSGTTAIAGDCFSSTDIKNVVLPNSLKIIGSTAFRECTSIKSITIPNSVTTINSYAFSGCESLTNIKIPNSVTTIDLGAFKNCKSFTSITFPDSVKNIGEHILYGCKALKKVTFPKGIKTIPAWAFAFCESLTEAGITIPDTVTTIDYYSFYHCPSLKKITIPKAVTKIERYAFGFKNENNISYQKDDLTICGYSGSAAEKYASQYIVNFEAIKEQTTTAKNKTTVKIPTKIATGTTATMVDKIIKNLKTDGDISGSQFRKLSAKQKKATNTSITITWNKVKNAKTYTIYGAKCGKSNSYKKIKTVKTTSLTQKKLKKGTYYKYVVVAFDKNKKSVSTSKTLHIATTGGKNGNHKSITTKAKKNKVTLKVKATFKLKATAVPQSKKLTVKNHRKIKYETSNSKIATVSAKGVIKAKKKGSCYVYAYAQNGVYKKIKVTVK